MEWLNVLNHELLVLVSLSSRHGLHGCFVICVGNRKHRNIHCLGGFGWDILTLSVDYGTSKPSVFC